ncbi:MAG TPA: hypothetical protein VEA69_07075 [Tepidisphaeraceae bacterium]|nr:hypothetical protein [Tepidisphaeraceae bacterium]
MEVRSEQTAPAHGRAPELAAGTSPATAAGPEYPGWRAERRAVTAAPAAVHVADADAGAWRRYTACRLRQFAAGR